MSESMLAQLTRGPRRRDEPPIYRVHGLLDLADAMEIAARRPARAEGRAVAAGHAAPAPPVVNGERSVFDEMRRGDILVHQPYESFATSFETFLRGVARPERGGDQDDGVPHIRRVAARPRARRGRRGGQASVCLVELKARFDERRNIEWARARAGGRPRRLRLPESEDPREDDARRPPRGRALRRYVHVGTGNYNSVTARSTRTSALFTADEDICADVADLFNYLTGFGEAAAVPQAPRRARRSAPACGRDRRVAAAARPASGADPDQGQPPHRPGADRRALRRLAGGRPDRLIARTNCVIRPGVEGMSETIRVRSRARPLPRAQPLFEFTPRHDDHTSAAPT